MKPHASLLELEIGVSLRLDLRAALAFATSKPKFEVREIARGELARVLGAAPALNRPAERVDAVAPSGWRCFVAFDGGSPIHVSFVEMRPGRPLLFGAVSEPAARGRGAFRETIQYIAARLHDAGETSLYSSVAWSNGPSLRAHAAVGLEIVCRRLDVRVLGISVRGVASRLLRRR
jgi:hypothetical protein